MTTRLGLGIGTDAVRAVLARDGRVVWTQSRAVNQADNLAEVIAETIRSAPLRRFPRTPAIAALGPTLVQVKRLAGVTASARGPVVSQLVRSNVSRFFLRNGIPLAVAAPYRNVGGWWGAAVDAPAVDSLETAFSNGAILFEGCVPSLTAIASITPLGEGSVELADGPVRARLHIRKGCWAEIRREHADGTGEAAAAAAITARHGLDPRFADALSAALSSPRSPLFLRTSRSRVTRRQFRAVRTCLSVGAFASVVAAFTAPGVAATRQAGRDAAKLDALRGTLAAWSPALAALRQTTFALNEIGRFSSERQSVALLLGAVSEALPDSTAIVNLRVDSAEVTITLLSLTAAAVVPRLASVPRILEPRIVGAVTRETVGSRQLQRVTVRFRLQSLEVRR